MYIKFCFDSYDLLHIWKIDETKFNNFLKVVKANYYDNPYHNFFHAMGVLHICYMFLRKAEAIKTVTPIDVYKLYINRHLLYY